MPKLFDTLKNLFPKKTFPDLTLENERYGVRVSTETPTEFSALISSENQIPVLKSVLENAKAGKKQ